MKKRSFHFLLTFIFVVFSFGIFTSGNVKITETYKTLASKSIEQKDVIKIPMGSKLMKTSINNKNIYVLDASKKSIPLSIAIDSSEKTIIVKPKNEYMVNKSYTLYISKNILFQNGKHPANSFKLSFKIRKTVELPFVGTLENLKKLISASNQTEADYNLKKSSSITNATTVITNSSNVDVVFSAGAVPESSSMSAGKVTATDGSSASSSDYSKTNVQVQGVDESDLVKTDGKYIYSINNNRIVIIKAVPSESMEQVGSIAFDEKSFTPFELYIDAESNKLVVIGNANPRAYFEKLDPEVMPYPSIQTTRAIIYDTSNKNELKKLREIDLEGNYLSSRKIGTKLYLITNKNMYYYMRQNLDLVQGIGETTNTDQMLNLTPSYRDTAKGSLFVNVKCSAIRYFPNSIQSNFMLIGVLDINQNEKPMSISTYLGSGNNVYMSEHNLYVAVNKFESIPVAQKPTETNANVKAMPGIMRPFNQNTNTLVYQFKVIDNGVDFAASGEVPGVILNQFSMDENKDTFRIATTKGNMWDTGANMSKNNLYVLDENMKITGSIVDMAPGEKIYSVRFINDRAYIVTYKKVDPLFVIDLKDKTKPKILGALKIPGYSDYLHPYDENHIIGFGKDSIEIPYKDEKGKVVGTNAYYLGMKIALFDVSDVSNPKEVSHEIIGDRGTYSQLLEDHKALLFSKEKNLMAFPVTEFKLANGQKSVNEQNGYAYPEYGTFSYQGAYVYSINVKVGFTLKGRITHLDDVDLMKAGSSGYNYFKEINRILYIGDTLYTNSNFMLKANNLKDMKEKGQLEIK